MISRFAIGQLNQPASSVWRLWNKKSDIYLLQRTMGKIQKFSFHASGICRWAQIKPRSDGNDRVLMRWERNPISPVGSGKGTKLIELMFPTSHLSAPKLQNKQINWIPPASQNHAIAVEVSLTMENPQSVLEAFAVRGERHILEIETLNDGSTLIIAYYQTSCGPVSMKVPVAPDLPGKVFGELNFPEIDETNSGRPVRMLQALEPASGVHPVFWELGGYKVGA